MIGILLAAGKGTRMKSSRPKVLFEINGEPLCMGPLRALMAQCDRVAVVVGHRGAEVKDTLLSFAKTEWGEKSVADKILFFTQEPPRGTGDAVRTALQGLGKNSAAQGPFVVVNGDLPLIRAQTLGRLHKVFLEQKLQAVCMSLKIPNPKGLGRILRDETGVFVGIREDKDASAQEKRIREVNGGVYIFDGHLLFEQVQHLKDSNSQGEFYLTDLVVADRSKGLRTDAYCLPRSWDLMGVNTTYELSFARKLAQARLQKKWSEEWGVDFMDPATTYVSAQTIFEGACRVGPGTVFSGNNRIQAEVDIQGQSFFEGAEIQVGAKILWSSVVRDSLVGPGSSVGPFAHLRPGSKLGKNVKVGNFVELKKTEMGDDSKASHLSYLGDAQVGSEANIGCGTITCNYDGFQKHPTRIGRGAFIGSDSQLVAPVTVGERAYVGSGTTVTQDIPDGALALSRPDLTIKPGYALRLTEKLARTKSNK